MNGPTSPSRSGDAPGDAPVTLFGLIGCPGAAALRTLFDVHGIAFTDVPLGQPQTPGDACGYTSPSVQITAGTRKPEFLVQPSGSAVVEALRAAGHLPRAPRTVRSAPF